MTAKEYLGQAYRLDQRINSKLEQVMSMRTLATKATSTLSDTPPSGTRNVHRMEDIIVKIIEMENEINRDIDNLVDLKREMVAVIKAVTDPEYQTILELRYLCFKSWEQIAVDMNYSIQHIYRLRDRALNEITPPASR
jgi:DNA-directed RNA polymerase specialized sigma subunit